MAPFLREAYTSLRNFIWPRRVNIEECFMNDICICVWNTNAYITAQELGSRFANNHSVISYLQSGLNIQPLALVMDGDISWDLVNYFGNKA